MKLEYVDAALSIEPGVFKFGLTTIVQSTLKTGVSVACENQP
jgi:hypothetical protein